MKYIIVSIYDDCTRFSICVNGEINADDNLKDKSNEALRKCWISPLLFNDWLKERYKDYDLIVVCEDGEIYILKDNTKEKI